MFVELTDTWYYHTGLTMQETTVCFLAINFLFWNEDIQVETCLIQTRQICKWDETIMVSNHYNFLLCFVEDDRPCLHGVCLDKLLHGMSFPKWYFPHHVWNSKVGTFPCCIPIIMNEMFCYFGSQFLHYTTVLHKLRESVQVNVLPQNEVLQIQQTVICNLMNRLWENIVCTQISYLYCYHQYISVLQAVFQSSVYIAMIKMII